MNYIEAIKRRSDKCQAHPQGLERFLKLVEGRTCYAVNGNHWMWRDIGVVARGRCDDGRSASLTVRTVFEGNDFTTVTTVTKDLSDHHEGVEEIACFKVFTKFVPPPWHKDFKK